jgi:tetratricopeptide (TPR) repeat protein
MSRLQQFIHEIHRRSLWQVLLIYVGGAWICYEIIDTITDRLALPEWLPVLAIILFLIGLPVVLATAFVHEVAPPMVAPAEWEQLTEAEAAGIEAEAAAVHLETRRTHRFLTWRNAAATFVIVLAAWGVVAAGWLLLGPSGDVVEEEFADAAPGIAVLPFSVSGEGLDDWRESMVLLLSTAMNGVGGLRTIDTRTVLARWREQVPETGEADRATALEVTQATGARYALLGSAVAIGQEVRLSADIYDTEGGAQMGAVQVEGSPDSVLALVDRLAVQSLVVVLEQEASELQSLDLASVTTASIPALTAWLEAEALSRRGNFEAAVPAYERAVAADSTFALAFYGLGNAYGWLEGEGNDRSLEAIEQAMRWLDRLPAREAALVRATHARTQWALREAEELLQRLVRTYPDYAVAWYGLGELYYHQGLSIPVSLEDAHRCFTRAAELDPQFASYRVHIIDLAFQIDSDSAQAARLIADYKRLASADAIETRSMEFAFDLAFGDQEHRDRALASLDTLDLQILRFAPWNPPLTHPRFWPQWEAVLLAKQRRVFGQPIQRWTTPALFQGAAMGRGYLRKGLEYLDHPRASSYDRGCLPVHALIDGFPVPADRLEEAAAVLSQIDSTSEPELVYCAAFLAEAQGRWADHARALELSWDLWRREVDAGRSGGYAKADALAVEAYGLWRRGDPEAAVEKLEEVRRYQASTWVRTVLGYVLMDLERWEEAVPYFRPWWLNTYSHAHYHLARAYEGMGEYGKAAKEYAFFVEAWEDADPELQPWVEDARRALERLASDR